MKGVYHEIDSSGIASLTKKLCEEFETITSMENSMLAEYGGVTEDDGSIHFPDADAAKEFTTAYKAAMGQDGEISLPTADLPKYVNMIRISANAIDALDGIVVFESD